MHVGYGRVDWWKASDLRTARQTNDPQGKQRGMTHRAKYPLKREAIYIFPRRKNHRVNVTGHSRRRPICATAVPGNGPAGAATKREAHGGRRRDKKRKLSFFGKLSDQGMQHSNHPLFIAHTTQSRKNAAGRKQGVPVGVAHKLKRENQAWDLPSVVRAQTQRCSVT